MRKYSKIFRVTAPKFGNRVLIGGVRVIIYLFFKEKETVLHFAEMNVVPRELRRFWQRKKYKNDFFLFSTGDISL